MQNDYDRGRRDGLRMALAVLAVEEEKWSALLGTSSSGRTNLSRSIRYKALQVAQSRLRTALNRLTPKESTAADAEIASALRKAGL